MCCMWEHDKMDPSHSNYVSQVEFVFRVCNRKYPNTTNLQQTTFMQKYGKSYK